MFTFEFDRERYLQEFGKAVRKYRQLADMSQEELAKKAGYTSRSSIAKIETGKADIPRAKIGILANALGVTVADLIPDGIISHDYIPDEDIALARRIAALDPYRRQLIEAILNTDPGQQKKT